MRFVTLLTGLLAFGSMATSSPTPLNDGSAKRGAATWTPVGAEPSGVAALNALVARRLPASLHNTISFNLNPALNGTGNDPFTIHSQGTQVTITSKTTSGLSRALLTYLREIGADITWSGDTFGQLKPTSLTKDILGSSWAEVRYFLNVVTYGYTTAFYGWDKWEYLLDWAALHGVNLPLATGGQEYIWAEVFRDFGLTDDVILPYFSGPAFQPWFRMGNIHNSWGGTVTQDWLNKQWDLQKQIISRMLALGMNPVLPGFSGFVPLQLHDKIGGPALLNASNWNYIGAKYSQNTAIDPTWTTWNVVQSAFLKKQQQLFGGWTSGYYSIDLYNELRPTSTDPAYLKANAQNVVKSIRDVDPKGVWVMQGWTFLNTGAWTTTAVSAFLGAMAVDQIIVLDLAAESMPVWGRTENFYGKKWVWNTLLNYGQNNGIYGALDDYNGKLTSARSTGGNLIGMGITPEGLNNNEVVYEMAMDTAWTTSQIDSATWIKDWVARRYQLSSSPGADAAQAAWALLLNSVYKSNDLNVKCTPRTIFDLQPTPNLGILTQTGNYLATKITYTTADVVSALDKLLAAVKADPKLAQMDAFTYDLVDVARQVFTNSGINPYKSLVAAWNANNQTGIQQYGTQIVSLLRDLDTMLATNKNFLLSTWIAEARQWGADDNAKKFMEYQARNQISQWGQPTFSTWLLDRYGAKHWHGIVGDVYATGWDMFWKYLQKNPPSTFKYDTWTGTLQAMEGQWEAQTWGSSANQTWTTTGDPVATITAMRAKWASIMV